VTDRLPNSVQLMTVDASQGKCALKQRTLTCDLGDIGFGEYYDPTATITVLVRTPSKAGKIKNTATVTSDTPDPYGQTDSDTEQTTVEAGAQPTCRGEVATIVGTPGANRLRGTNGKDVIQARGGDDKVRGGGADDKVIGGGGNDRLGGQAGDDVLKGNAGRDRLKGGSGDDALRGGPGNDRCHGGGGDDKTSSC
jgi:Ca2+-binding RTX toxin-like protein